MGGDSVGRAGVRGAGAEGGGSNGGARMERVVEHSGCCPSMQSPIPRFPTTIPCYLSRRSVCLYISVSHCPCLYMSLCLPICLSVSLCTVLHMDKHVHIIHTFRYNGRTFENRLIYNVILFETLRVCFGDYVCMFAYVCVTISDRETERDRKRQRDICRETINEPFDRAS